MNFSDKTWNIINSIGAFLILAGVTLMYEQRIGLPGGLRNVWEVMIWMFFFSMMAALAALIAWLCYRYSRKSSDSKISKMRYTYWLLIWSLVFMAGIKFMPDGIF